MLSKVIFSSKQKNAVEKTQEWGRILRKKRLVKTKGKDEGKGEKKDIGRKKSRWGEIKRRTKIRRENPEKKNEKTKCRRESLEWKYI